MHTRLKRVARWSRRVAYSLLGALILIPLVARAALMTVPGRELLRTQLLSALDGVIDGKLIVDRIDHVSLTRIRLRGVHVLDLAGHEVASAQRASALVEPWALLHARVVIARIWVESPRVALGDPTRDAGETGGLLDVIPSTEPADPAVESLESPSPWTVLMRRIDVSDGFVDVQLDGTNYALQRLHARGSLGVEQEISVETTRLFAHVTRTGDDVAALSATRLRYATDDSASAKVHAWIGASQLWLDGQLGGTDSTTTEPTPQRVAVKLHADQLGPAALTAFGIDTAPWNAPLDLKLAAHGDTSAIEYSVVVFAREGQAQIDGDWHAPARFALNLRSQGLALRSVIESDVAPISGVFDAKLDALADGSAATLALDVTDATYDGMALPTSHIAGRWSTAEGLVLPEVHAHYPTARLDASVSVSPQNVISTQLYMRADALSDLALVRRLAPGVRGCVEVNGRARVPLDHPLDGHVDLRAHGDGLALKDTRIENADLTLVGGPSRYALTLDLHELGRIALNATRTGDRLHADGGGTVRIGKERSRFSLNDLVCHGDCEAVQIGRLRVEHAGAVASISGLVTPGAPSHLTLEVDAPDLARVTAAWVDPPIAGALSLSATLDGALARPKLTGHAQGYVEHISTLDDVTFALHATAELGPRPVVAADVTANLRFVGDDHAVDVSAEGTYETSHVALRVEGADAQGPLFRTHLSTDLSRAGPPTNRDGLAAFLQERAWDASVWVAARRIADLPGVRMLGVGEALLPAKLSAHGKLSHAPGQPPEGEVELRAAFDPSSAVTAASCGVAHRPVVTLHAQMGDGKLTSFARLDVAGTERARVEGHTEAPLSAWLTAVEPTRVTLSAVLSELQLSDVPLLCEHIDGRVSGTATVERAAPVGRGRADPVSVAIDLTGTRMHAVGQPQCFNLVLSGTMAGDAVEARATFDSAQGHAVIDARLPIDAGGHAPTVDLDAPLSVHATLRRIELPALFAFVPQVRSRSGTIEGELRATGSINAPQLRGDLRLIDASILLPELGQPFEHMNGRLQLDGRTLRLEKMRIHDRDGHADVTAEVTLRDDRSLVAQAKLDANNLPIRRDGVILARLDGKLAIDVALTPARTELSIKVRDAAVELMQTDAFSGVQALAENPEIHFVDGAPGQLPEETEPKQADGTLRVSIDAREPFWMRRDDFSLLVSTQLVIEMVDDAPAVTGSVEIHRGVVELIGQSFDVEHGRISFAGGHELEPTLEIVAQQRASGGAIVTVEANGTVRQPELRFLVDGAPVTAGEALAAAAGSRTGDGSGAAVEQQMGAMATGVLSGVLTLGARRSLGEWVPVLAIENTETESRLRAGIDARSLIPPFLRPIVVDAYVEGILSSTKNRNGTETEAADASPQTAAAVLLELRFPHNLVGEAQYGPGARWSTDVSWEP